MAARVVHRQGCPRHHHDRAGTGTAGHTVPQTAAIKAHPTPPNHPRPYGILDARLRLVPIGCQDPTPSNES